MADLTKEEISKKLLQQFDEAFQRIIEHPIQPGSPEFFENLKQQFPEDTKFDLSPDKQTLLVSMPIPRISVLLDIKL